MFQELKESLILMMDVYMKLGWHIRLLITVLLLIGLYISIRFILSTIWTLDHHRDLELVR